MINATHVPGVRSGVRIPARVGGISPLQNVQTGSRAYPSIRSVAAGFFPWSKTAGMCVSAHLQLAPRLRMHGAMPPCHGQGEV